MSHNSNHGEKVKKGKKKGKKLKPGPGSLVHVDSAEVFWHEVDAEMLAVVVDAVTEKGGAVMFSKSSDGGALGVRVYHDDHTVETVWGRPDDGFAVQLGEIAKYYRDYVEDEEGE